LSYLKKSLNRFDEKAYKLCQLLKASLALTNGFSRAASDHINGPLKASGIDNLPPNTFLVAFETGQTANSSLQTPFMIGLMAF
jgi:hypothetical protein